MLDRKLKRGSFHIVPISCSQLESALSSVLGSYRHSGRYENCHEVTSKEYLIEGQLNH